MSAKNKSRNKARKAKRRRLREDLNPFGCCISCDTPLGIQGGYAETDLCGPCCCGEAALFAEFGSSW